MTACRDWEWIEKFNCSVACDVRSKFVPKTIGALNRSGAVRVLGVAIVACPKSLLEVGRVQDQVYRFIGLLVG
jgi:hypothetical protein